jgi:hypothetical protein
MPHTVEKLQDLDRALPAEANGVTILRGLYRTVLPRECGSHSRELVDARAIIEEVVHHLIHNPLRDLFA